MTISNFDIATDLKVQMWLPILVINPFILGLSTLGGADVLDGDLDPETNWDWVNVEAVTTKADVQTGGEISNSLFFTPSPAKLSLQLQSYVFDPNANKSIRSGTKIRTLLDDGTTTTTLFNGFIDTIDVSYDPKGFNLINVTAYDRYKSEANSRVNYDTSGYTTVYPGDVLDLVITGAGGTLDPDSDLGTILLPPEAITNNPTTGASIRKVLDASLGIIWVDPESGNYIFKNRPEPIVGTPPAGIYTVGNNHPIPPATDAYHLCMSGIDASADSSQVVNSLKAILASDDTISIVKTNQDSIELYGNIANDVIVNVLDSAQLDIWAENAFNISPTKLVDNVETPAIDRLGTLTHAAFMQPGENIRVYYEKDDLAIIDYYQVIQVSHSITVNNWITNLTLWRAF